jgi:hypothetical protein
VVGVPDDRTPSRRSRVQVTTVAGTDTRSERKDRQ